MPAEYTRHQNVLLCVMIVSLSLSCSHVVRRMRQSKCSRGLGQQPPSVRRSIACSPSGGPCRSSGANSSLVVPSTSVPAGSIEELGWQVFRAEVLRPSQLRRRLYMIGDTGRCLARVLTSSFVMKSLHLMPRIFRMHLLSKASSFFS